MGDDRREGEEREERRGEERATLYLTIFLMLYSYQLLGTRGSKPLAAASFLKNSLWFFQFVQYCEGPFEEIRGEERRRDRE